MILFGDRNTIGLRVNRNVWDNALILVGESKKFTETEIIDKLIKKDKNQNKTIKNLQKKIDINSELNKKLKIEFNELRNEFSLFEDERKKINENKIIYKTLRKRFQILESDHEKLKSMYNKLEDNPIIKEKIVYKENKKQINELKEKNEKLQKKLWEKVEVIEKLNSELRSLKVKLNNIEECKKKKYGIIVKIKPKEDKENDSIFETEFISSSEYNMWLRDRTEFLQSKNIDVPFHIIDIGRDSF